MRPPVTVNQDGKVLDELTLETCRRFGVKYEEVTPQQRNAVKAALHGARYGMGPQQFSAWMKREAQARS
jgi:DNA polymerase I-like protein with 3'-5' exonuclease and polymerase domains